MEKYTEDQITRANEVNLVRFLSSRGERFKKAGREYRWEKHDSVTICENKWYRHSQGKGGWPVDFMMEFYDLSFPDAVKELLDGEEARVGLKTSLSEKRAIPYVEDGGLAVADPIPTKEMVLPEADENQDHIMEYLVDQRKLDKDIVSEFIKRGDIYQEKDHQRVVFVGRDSEGNPRYASWRNAGEEQLRGDVSGSQKEYGFKSVAFWDEDKQRKRLARKLYVFESPIDLLSFITLYPKYWHENHYLSLGGVSAKALKTFLSERSEVEQIILCLDNDKAGHEACAKLFDSIPSRYTVNQLVPSKKDWNEVLVNRSGDPGQGKTWLAMHLAAACTNRKELPNELPMDSFNVFYQTAEDGIGDTIKPRLMQCGADMERVRVIVEDDAMLSLTDPRLELAIKQNNVKLLIMDPIQAYLGPDVDMNRANEIRPLFRYLGGVAERTGAAIVLIGHLNKNAGTHANYRGLGSVDISAAVRSILLVGKVEKETERDVRVVIQTKSSLAPKPTPVAFTLENSKLEWIGEYEITEQELMSGKAGKQKETKLEQAMKLIRQILTTRNLMYVADLDAEGKKLKISDRTMRDARRKLEDELDYGYENSKKTICLKK